MLRNCVQLFGRARDTDGDESRRAKHLKASPHTDASFGDASVSMSMTGMAGFVRIVHRGGREELFPHELSASRLMEKYPGTRVAKPEIFRNPHGSILWPEEKLSLGQKYLIIPASAVQKLKRKHPERSESSGWNNVSMGPGNVNFEESVFSAKEFYVSKGSSGVKGIRKKKAFVPPLPRTRSFRSAMWEPSLTSVQEISP